MAAAVYLAASSQGFLQEAIETEIMAISLFRILVATMFSIVVYMLYEIHFLTIDLPEMATSYIQWWRSQPLTALQEFMLRYAMLMHWVLLLSLVGIGLLWSPARYVFAGTILLGVLREAAWSLPIVVTGRQVVLDNLIVMMAGMIIFAMFFTPLRDQFVNNPLKKRNS